MEYYEMRLGDLQDKVSKLKLKTENMAKENDILVKAQTKFNLDKQDIVEFLNIKVFEHEKLLGQFEHKCYVLEEENSLLEPNSKAELENLKTTTAKAMENLSQKCTKYKLELLELTLFTEQKAALEQELVNAKTLLEKKELDFKDTIHSLERKVLQDKNRMKREMLQKLNEAVASFRRVADQQMAEADTCINNRRQNEPSGKIWQ
jgi:predicted nucleic acid-binding protein